MSDDITGGWSGYPGTRRYTPPSQDAWRSANAQAPSVRERRRFLAPVLAAVVVAFIVAAFAGAAAGFFGASMVVSGLQGTTSTVKVTGQTDEPVAAAASAALPSVVNIDVTGTEDAETDGMGMPKNHPKVPVTGNGSGVAFRKVSTGGTYIITNNHVIEGATRIVVTPVGGKRTTATLVGADPDTDIAVVRIGTTLPVIRLADSKKLSVGAVVVAIGSPYGLEHSVSSGVISALHRSLPPSASDASGTASLVDVIQTDAAINPGNSGGALVDRQGRLIGVNSAIFSSSGSNDGIGFAIPVNTVAGIADELIASGKVRHPFLGVVGQTVNEATAAEKKLPAAEGALVLSVVKESGADRAGIKPGDLIVKVDDAAVGSMEDLIAAVRNAGVGKTVKVELIRDRKSVTLSMTVGVKPSK